jgi:hypothetical protein
LLTSNLASLYSNWNSPFPTDPDFGLSDEGLEIRVQVVRLDMLMDGDLVETWDVLVGHSIV